MPETERKAKTTGCGKGAETLEFEQSLKSVYLGASINDVHKVFGFLDPPRPHLRLNYTTKFTPMMNAFP